MFRKFKLLWDSVELVDSEDQYTVADVSPPLRAAGLINHFGVLLPLSALGLVATWRDRRRLTILYLLLATYASSVLLFYVFARYRYPLVPLLAPVCGRGRRARMALDPRRTGPQTCGLRGSRARCGAALEPRHEPHRTDCARSPTTTSRTTTGPVAMQRPPSITTGTRSSSPTDSRRPTTRWLQPISR